jgi:hypothetical protein
MVTSCFFCQNLLSDLIEGLLPLARSQELESHLEGCRVCAGIHHDLVSTLEVLHALPGRALSADLALRIHESVRAGSGKLLSPARVSRMILFAAIPILGAIGTVYAFPGYFPWFTRFRHSQSAQFVRYFPLLQGATEIIEEQSNWIHTREPLMRSLWEEGGLSPEEFEKAFQSRPSPSTLPASLPRKDPAAKESDNKDKERDSRDKETETGEDTK